MTGEKTASDTRKERLAKALKANLSRRKTQARNRQTGERPAAGPEESDTEDGCPN